MKRLGVALGLVLTLCAGTALADLLEYNFTLDGLQEVPPVATPATGTAKVTLDTDTNELNWEITYQDLIGTLTAAHFHGPAGVGQNAGVIVPITIGPSPIVGTANITEQVEAHIVGGMSYVNMHTDFRPGGEIRGQVVPEPAGLMLLALLAPLMRRR